MTSDDSSEGKLIQQEAPIQKTAPPGIENTLVALATALALSEGVFQLVEE